MFEAAMSTERSARSAAVVAGIAAFALIAQQVASKAIRDGFFLSHFSATELPRVMVAAAGLAVVVVLGVGKLMGRFSPRRVAPVLIALHAGLFVAEWGVARVNPRVAAAVVYLHTAAFGAAVISAFYSSVNERFDPHTARKVISRIAVGATAGGVVGGLGAWQLSTRAEVADLLPVLAGIGAVAIVALAIFARGGHSEPRVPESNEGGLVVLAKTPYLGYLALLVGLGALAEAAIDYVFKASADAAFDSSAELVSFFALFHTALGIGTFLIQLSLSRRSLEKLGLAATVASLPAAIIGVGIVAVATPMLATATALRGAHGALENSLFRSGYELFYTPLPPAIKRPTKTLVDVGAEKLGAAAGGGLALLAVLANPAVTTSILLIIAIMAGVAMLAVSRRLSRGYIQALADSLRSGAIELDPDERLDATTRQTLGDTTALDRNQLLAEIDALREREGDGPVEHPEPSIDMTDPIVAAVADLRSSDRARVRAALRRSSPIDPLLVAHAIELLARPEHLAAAVAALSTGLPRITGQLGDALCDPETDVVIRRRLPRVLRGCSSPKAINALMGALEDPVFEVRYRSAAALLHIVERDGVKLDADAVMKLALAEVQRGTGKNKLADSDDDLRTTFEREAAAHAIDETLTYVFTLLALVGDREPLHLAFCALAAPDQKLRGTGREYLDNVLPPPMREALAPALDLRSSGKIQQRPKAEIVRELQASTDSLRLDPEVLEQLRRKTTTS